MGFHVGQLRPDTICWWLSFGLWNHWHWQGDKMYKLIWLVIYLSTYAAKFIHLVQDWNRVLVSIISWPGQLLSLNPCWRQKILARMLFLGDFVFNSSNSWDYSLLDYRLWLLVKTNQCIRNIIFKLRITGVCHGLPVLWITTWDYYIRCMRCSTVPDVWLGHWKGKLDVVQLCETQMIRLSL